MIRSLFFVAMFLPLLAWGQNTIIKGVVVDSTGGALPGTSIMLESTSLNVPPMTQTTNDSGEFQFDELQAGEYYTLTLQLNGFETVVKETSTSVLGEEIRLLEPIIMPLAGFDENVTVVTSRKREEDVQEVPFSVVASTEEDLRTWSADNIEDVATNVAGFSVQNLGPGQSQVAIRGVSSGQITRDLPGVKEQVGIYLDESVISMPLFTPDMDLFDMSRIEVLRGPQGTLFGSGSLSGTVRYITNQPELGQFETIGEAGASDMYGGGFGNSTKLAVNLPVGDTAAARITAYNTRFGGFMDAVQPDLSVQQDVNSGRRSGVRAAFRWEPHDRFSVTPRLQYQEMAMDGWNRIDAYNILANPYTTTRPDVTLGERQFFIQMDEPYFDEFLLGDIKASYNFGPAELTSISSGIYRDIHVTRDATALGGSVSFSPFGAPEAGYTLDMPLIDASTVESFTQETRLSGETDRVNWVVGHFYNTTDRDYGQSAYAENYVAINGPAVSSFLQTVTGSPNLVWTGSRSLPGQPNVEELFYSDLNYDFQQSAVFGELSYRLNDRFQVTGGLRWYDFTETRSQLFDGLFADPTDTVGTVEARGFAPRFIASYDLTDDVQLNAVASKGFRLGGINDPLNIPLCTEEDLRTFGGRETWDDEELWNYEVGTKTRIFGGRGTLNVAGFYMDIRNLQTTATAGTCSSRIIFNVPKARSVGMELELALQPYESFDIAASASLSDGRLKSTLTSTATDGSVSVVSGIEDGNRFPTTPLFQAAAAATYNWRVSEGWNGYMSGVFQHVGPRFTQVGDHAEGFGSVDLASFSPDLYPGMNIGGPLTQSHFIFNPELPAYNILNTRVGFLKGPWDIAFFVNNVTDERAFLALDQERGTHARVGYLTNPPRSLGINTRFSF